MSQFLLTFLQSNCPQQIWFLKNKIYLLHLIFLAKTIPHKFILFSKQMCLILQENHLQIIPCKFPKLFSVFLTPTFYFIENFHHNIYYLICLNVQFHLFYLKKIILQRLIRLTMQKFLDHLYIHFQKYLHKCSLMQMFIFLDHLACLIPNFLHISNHFLNKIYLNPKIWIFQISLCKKIHHQIRVTHHLLKLLLEKKYLKNNDHHHNILFPSHLAFYLTIILHSIDLTKDSNNMEAHILSINHY